MALLSIRRRISVDDEHGGDFHQFIGYIDTENVPVTGEMTDEERAKRFIEYAYEQSSLRKVHRQDDHEIALIEKRKQVESEVLTESDENEEAEQE